MIAVNLVSWLQLVVLSGGPEASVRDVKRRRCRLFSIAGKIVSGGRQRRLLIPEKTSEVLLLCQLHEGHRLVVPAVAVRRVGCMNGQRLSLCFFGVERFFQPR